MDGGGSPALLMNEASAQQQAEPQPMDVDASAGGEQPGTGGEAEPAPDTNPQERDQTKSASTTDAASPVAKPPKQKSGAYTLREELLQAQENEGTITFSYVENDGQPTSMIYLVGLKNIFSKQLPNMPKEYICRLVLDRRHKSVALVKRNGVVVGGITYRAFHEQGFGEIAFCAITASEQVKGFGTRLMNYAKEFAVKRDHLTHFLTYADNAAVGYFTKQGFTKEITLPKDRWNGYIKDYDGGTLMECVMHPKIPYAHFPDMIGAQRAALEAMVRNVSNSHEIHKGLAAFKPGTKRQRVPIASIPGVKEAGWTQERYGSTNKYRLMTRDGPAEATPEALQKFMQKIMQEIDRSDEAWPFREAVNRQDVPDYYDVIKDPIDLSLINQRLKNGSYYLTLDIFIADLRRMFNNCRLYNAADTIYYKIATKLEGFLDEYVNQHLIYE